MSQEFRCLWPKLDLVVDGGVIGEEGGRLRRPGLAQQLWISLFVDRTRSSGQGGEPITTHIQYETAHKFSLFLVLV